jgi:hypothetical protein
MHRFDVVFDGSNAKLTLTTAPGAPATHWQQMRCLFQEPLRVQDGDCLVGKVTLRATRQQSYTAHGDIWCPPPPHNRCNSDRNVPDTPCSVARRVGAQLTTVGSCKASNRRSRANIYYLCAFLCFCCIMPLPILPIRLNSQGEWNIKDPV